jgi:hypothetical protein
MNIQGYKRLNSEDFKPDDRELVTQLSYHLNPILESLSDACTGNLTFNENIKGNIVELDDVNSSTSNITINVNFSFNGLYLISVFNKTDINGGVTSCPYVQWSKDGSGFKIEKILGLIDSKQYNIKILVI